MNGYFRLVNREGASSLKLFPPKGDGKPIDVSDVVEYLTMKDYTCDLPTLKRAVQSAEKEQQEISLGNETRLPERECYKLRIGPDRMQAFAKFYAASEGGENMTADEMIKDLALQGIKCGIRKENIEGFFAKRDYLEEILVAEGREPVQGKNAFIEYKFNTDKKVKPTLKEDGSVDFFHLNILNHCNKGDVLAVLHPEVPGEPGEDLAGNRILPAEVRKETLKFGRNIEISEDRTTLTAQVDGHVELVEGSVFVSDELVVENVDNSTGNIDYEGNVQINGNVATNFQVKANGDIVVKGVVEGAQLIAGGNIIIARGMNGMGRGVLKADGNIVAKFLENVTAEAEGYVASESILHSRVTAGGEVNVDGRRGFITGGKVSAAGSIHVKTLGSQMGADTIVEVGTDPKLKERINQLQKQIGEDTKLLQTVQPTLISAKQKLAKGARLSPEQIQQIQSMAALNKEKTEAIAAANKEIEQLQKQTVSSSETMICVKGEVYPGTRICIGDVSMVVQKTTHYCRFIRERGDVKMAPL
ncbi:MAG: FapA family protein [Lachnospiraceae bacterium]|nr:FapA family protein [Lachnospiraceae bacterium]